MRNALILMTPASLNKKQNRLSPVLFFYVGKSVSYLITPAFFKVVYAPFLLIVRIAFVESVRLRVFLISGTYTFFFWRFAYFRTLPVGVNFVARVRLLYPAPILEDFPVTAHSFAIIIKWERPQINVYNL